MNTPQSKPQIKDDWITRSPKWMLLGAFWIVQGIVLYLVQVFLYQSQSSAGMTTTSNEVIMIAPKGFFGEWPSLEDYLDLLTNAKVAMTMAITIAVLTIAQMIFLLPVRRPGLMGTRGHSVKRSIYTAGLIIGGLVLAVVMTVFEYLHRVHDVDLFAFALSPTGKHYMMMAIVVLLGWAIATPLMFKFTKPGRKEDVLARLSKKLFIGTIIEIALLIPLDVMVRRKTSCYCWAGSYWALTLCGFIGVFALGPAVFLPILSKRRKTWYSGHCGVCGYDMVGMLEAPRCPECGTGWRAPKPKTNTESTISDTIDQKQPTA